MTETKFNMIFNHCWNRLWPLPSLCPLSFEEREQIGAMAWRILFEHEQEAERTLDRGAA
jgi:hypothetical protein